MSAWNDFNDAEQQQSFDLIPKGTVAPVRMTIKPGGHDDAAQGWTGGYATQSFETGSIFLACEFVILDGEYARRKMWSNVGLQSNKGPAWGPGIGLDGQQRGGASGRQRQHLSTQGASRKQDRRHRGTDHGPLKGDQTWGLGSARIRL